MEQPQQQEQPSYQDPSLHYCTFHPGSETGLACGKCGNYICTRCIIQTPVGARCKDCARVATVPTFEVQPSYFFRAVFAGGLTAIVTGLAVLMILSRFGGLPFLASVLAIGGGYLVGEAISAAVNRKRGTGLAVVAGGCMVLFSIASGLIFYLGNIFGLLMLGLAFYSAINRVR